MGFPGGTGGKVPTCQHRRQKIYGFNPWVRKIPWRSGLPGSPLQYSCLENPMDRGVWQATVHKVKKSQAQLKQLSTHTCNDINPQSVIIELLMHNSMRLRETY